MGAVPDTAQPGVFLKQQSGETKELPSRAPNNTQTPRTETVSFLLESLWCGWTVREIDFTVFPGFYEA